MSILLWSDLHLDQFKQFSTIREDGFNSRLVEQLRVVRQVCKIIEKYNVTHTVFLGDLINPIGESLPKVVYNAAYFVAKAISKLAEVQLAESYFIIGNHDLYRGSHILSAFADLKNLRVINQPTVVKLDGIDCDMIPWGYPVSRKSDVLLAHAEVDKSILTYASDAPDVDPVPTEALRDYKYIFLGHWHTRQRIKVSAKEAMYVGSVMQTSFSDTDEDRGVHLFDGSNVTFIPISSPHFHKAEVGSEEALENFTQIYENDKRSYFLLSVKTSGLKIPTFDHRVRVEFNIKPRQETRIMQEAGEPLLQVVNKFIDQANTQINKEDAKAYAQEILKNV